MNVSSGPNASGPPRLDLYEVLRTVVVPKETKDGWLVLSKPGQKTETKSEPDPVVSLKLLRTMFKRDLPYRTVLSSAGNITTNASGVLNFQQSVSQLNSATEWTVLDALFDEVFVHSMTLHYNPLNKNVSSGAGAASSSVVSLQTSTTAAPMQITNVGLVMCCLFSNPAWFAGAAGISNCPNRRYAHSAEPFVYTWRNNVRFDSRGYAFSGAAPTYGWQGWTAIADAQYLGGGIQIRCMNDAALGDLTHTWTIGQYHCEWDISMRARA